MKDCMALRILLDVVETFEVKVWVHKVDLNGSAVTKVTVCGMQLANGTTEYAANLLAKRLGGKRYGVFEVPTGKYETRTVLE